MADTTYGGKSETIVAICATLAGWILPLLAVWFIAIPLGAACFDLLAEPLAYLRRAFPSLAQAQQLAQILGATAAMAAGAATLALLFAVVLLLFGMRLSPLVRGLTWCLAAVSFLIPGHFMAIAWIQTIGYAGWATALARYIGPGLAESLPAWLYSFPGATLILALHRFPIILALLLVGWRALPAAALEAGVTLLRPGRLWRRLLLQWLRPWWTVGWLLVFLLALLDYALPFMLRQRPYVGEIIAAFNLYYEPRLAMALALPLIALSLLAAAALGLALRDVHWPAAARRGLRLPPPGMHGVLSAATVLVLVGATVLPLSTLILMAGPPASYHTIYTSARGQLGSSLGLSALSACVTAVLAAGLTTRGTWISAHPRNPAMRLTLAFRGACSGAMCVLLGLPPASVAVALIAFWNNPMHGRWGAWFYDSGLLLPLGLLILHLPIAYLIVRARVRQTPRCLLEAQQLAPTPGRRWFLLLAPRLAVPIFVAAALVFVLNLQEVQGTMLLAAPGQETASVRAMTLLHFAPDRLVAAFCLLVLLSLAGAVAGLALLIRLVLRLLSHWVPGYALD